MICLYVADLLIFCYDIETFNETKIFLSKNSGTKDPGEDNVNLRQKNY